MYLGEYDLNDWITIPAISHIPSTGELSDVDTGPTYRIYESETATAILTGSMTKLDDDNTLGFYTERVQVTTANGFNLQRSYTIYITGVIGAVTGGLSHTFRTSASPAAARQASDDNKTAQELVRAAYRKLAIIRPTSSELEDGLDAMAMMLRNWSSLNMNLFYVKQDTHTLDGSQSYTIGEDGTPDIDTVRPNSIRGAYVRDSNNFDHPVRIIDEDKYRRLRLKNISGDVEYLYYNPTYPNGTIYVFPTGGTTLYLDSLKPLTVPSGMTSEVSFPPEYQEAIVYNLAIRMAPEFGKEVAAEAVAIAGTAIRNLQSNNFESLWNSVTVDPIRFTGRYNIDEG